ncbi:disease resistance protein RGA2-like [Silene latifolia]|uniref:disease resistance protein RGA2-like n=1 Tax=Silene latifolia TaxID=37657 RepID=UPI003D78A8D0
MGGWLEHLSALQCLRIYDCPNLLQGGIPWQHFPETLQSLCLESFKEMEELPEGMQYCTSLQSLEIRDCPKLEYADACFPANVDDVLADYHLSKCQVSLLNINNYTFAKSKRKTWMQAMCSITDCKRELEDLQNTVQTVKAVLEDADAKQDSLNSQEKHYIKELKDAVYDADDVLDEFLTLAKRKQLIQAGDRVSDKVKSFFSRFKLLTHSISNKVKMVNKRLDGIAAKSSKFSFKVEYTPTKFTKEETSSFLCDEIIGRGEDVERIVGMLLGSDNGEQSNVSFLEKWNLREFLGKVVKDLPVDNKHELTSLEQIHHEVREKLGGKKYLLVLDDVWTESFDKWQQFEAFLRVGQRGSRIVVTTRSKTTAQMIGGDQVHELRGLSETESWHLFERMAFHVKERDDKLVELGKEIVKKCTNVPLAIRVVGSLLRGQSKSMWLTFHENGLETINESNDSMTRILKLSYDQLEPSLKICFAYCAIFPKDWGISKQMLIYLWMAQGYINLENQGEEYFLMLLQRCFFQDVLENEYGEIKWFKMHDLFHDIAEQVAGEEISRLDFDTSNVGKGVRHLSLMDDYYTDDIFNKTHIRTYLQVIEDNGVTRMCSADQFLASKSVLKWTCLRSLDLRRSHAESLPESIGQLLHLRCLDLSECSQLRILPKSITKLVNLQTLDLQECFRLHELPNDVSKLANLSTLNLAGCESLIRMPSDIGMLTCLRTLCQFVVGVRGGLNPKQCFNGLKDLQHLNKLQGSLKIEIAVLKNAKFIKEEHGRGGCLRNKEHLKNIVINFTTDEEYGSKEYEQALLEEMQPHHDVRNLTLSGYHCETMPKWLGRRDNSTLFDLPNLTTLNIYSCGKLKWLPWEIAKMPHLKRLHLEELGNLEYVVAVDPGTPGSSEGLFFSSLVAINFSLLPKLKAWCWSSESGLHAVKPDNGGSNQEPHIVWGGIPWQHLPGSLKFLSLTSSEEMEELPEGMQYCTSLQSLKITGCPKLECLPEWMPKLTSLRKLQLPSMFEEAQGKMPTTKWRGLAPHPTHPPHLYSDFIR